MFRHVNQYFNIDPKDEQSIIVGILDPPRAGLSTKVITSCRKLEKMRKLIYVSCDPRSALKNIVDLCRPESKRYDGNPFTVQQIRPVDMFPNTKHLGKMMFAGKQFAKSLFILASHITVFQIFLTKR